MTNVTTVKQHALSILEGDGYRAAVKQAAKELDIALTEAQENYLTFIIGWKANENQPR